MSYTVKHLLKHASVYGVGRFATKAAGFLLIPLYTRYLTPQDYGVQDVLSVAVILAGIMIQGGTATALFKFYNYYTSQEERGVLIGTLLVYLTSVCVVLALMVWIFADQVSYLLMADRAYGAFVKLILVSFVFSIISTVPETLLMAQKRSKLFSVITLTTLIVNLGLNVYMVAVAKRGLEGILYASILARIFNTCLNLYATYPFIRFRFDWSILRRLLSFSVPLIPAEMGTFVCTFADRLFLSHMSTLTSVGLYSLGSRFPFMISFLLIQPFMQIWQQEMYEVKERSDAAKIFGEVFTYFVAIIAMAGAVLSIFIKDVIWVMAGRDFVQAWRVVPVICVAHLFKGVQEYFKMGMLFKNKTRYIGYISLGGAATVAALNYFLVPVLAELGAACAQLGGYVFLAVASFVVSQRLYGIRIELSRLYRLVGAIILVVGFYLWIDLNQVLISVLFRISAIPFLMIVAYRLRLLPTAMNGRIVRLGL